MNERDSEIIAQLLIPLDYVLTEEVDQADAIVLNTCSIRDKAEQKVYSLLGQLRAYCSDDSSIKPVIIVAGCVAQQEGEKIFQRMPHVNIVIGTQQMYSLPKLITDLKGKKRLIAIDLSSSFTIPSFKQTSDCSFKETSDSTTLPCAPSVQHQKFVTIMQGCNNFCTYCVVPFTRGREASRSVTDIIDEVQSHVDNGVKEITLVGQNVNSYGMTNTVGKSIISFAELLHRVSQVTGVERLRFTTSNPHDLSDDLIDCFQTIDNLCPHFHLPVQSGSDDVLHRMRRQYTIDDYLTKVDKLRSANPKIAISTDMIIGFPGETDEDFAATMDLLETVRFHSSYSFKYSDRPSTRSAHFKDKVDEKIKSVRLQLYMKRQDEITYEHNITYLDKIVQVMLDGYGKNTNIKGRTGTNHIVHLKNVADTHPLELGDIVNVRIVTAGKHSLIGQLVSGSR